MEDESSRNSSPRAERIWRGLDVEIVELEKRPDDENLLASIFRTIHTIKGTCGFIGLTVLSAVAHSAENVLGQMRGRRDPRHAGEYLARPRSRRHDRRPLKQSRRPDRNLHKITPV